MFVRATRLKAPSDRIDALIGDFKESVVPAVKKLAGNRGAILLVDRDNGIGLGLTYWEDEASLKASDDAGTSLRGQVAQAAGATIEDVDRFELAIQERTGPPRAGTFVRITDVQGDPARVEDGIRYSRDVAVPAVRAHKGFRAFITSVNRQTGRGITATVWETLEDLKASESAIAPIREGAVKATGATSVRVEIMESVFVELSLPVTSA
jgi:heme-degrading monooxygenase HmoA